MTAKRFVRKTFRKARRKVCRYIISFDRCPASYRKSYKDIILNAVHVYAGEPYHNIIINDLDGLGLELLEYRYEEPMFLYRRKDTSE